jgi:hypothetical protein
MVDDFTIAGPTDVWIDRLREVSALGITRINIFLLRKEKLEMAEALAADVFPVLREA